MSNDGATENGTIEKVSIIVSKGSLEGIYPALIMANGARAEGIEANLFFTDFIDQVKDIITVGEFYGLAAGGQIIFT
jgi:DsrE/DsrF/DrsH-like family